MKIFFDCLYRLMMLGKFIHTITLSNTDYFWLKQMLLTHLIRGSERICNQIISNLIVYNMTAFKSKKYINYFIKIDTGHIGLFNNLHALKKYFVNSIVWLVFQEWGANCPHEFVGAYKLEYDMSWTPIEEVDEKTQEFALIDKILNAQNAITDSVEPNLNGLTKSQSAAKITDITDKPPAWCLHGVVFLRGSHCIVVIYLFFFI